MLDKNNEIFKSSDYFNQPFDGFYFQKKRSWRKLNLLGYFFRLKRNKNKQLKV